MKRTTLNIKVVFFFVLCCFLHNRVAAQLRINEFLASNSTTVYDPDFGVFADFVELYNASSFPISLANYSISDKPENKKKWIFPEITLESGQYLILWADGNNKYIGDTAYSEFKRKNIEVSALHLNFKLSADGEYLGLFDAKGKLVDEIKFGVQENDVSYGRNTSNSNEWQFFNEVSPGNINSNYGANSLIYASEPTFNIQGGFYPSTQSLQISSSESEAEIRFTFDGSEPTRQSILIGTSFDVIRNYVIRARAYVPGKLPSPVVTSTYFIGESISLPVISLSSNAKDLFGFDFGIIRNSIKDREVPGFVEYYDENKKLAFSTGVGLKLFGTTIFTLPQKPLSIRFKSKFGIDELQYKLFEDRDNERFKSIQLRNGGNDYNLSYFRDGLATNLFKGKIDLDYQEYKPCVVFINGDYHGIYEIRERLDAQYLSDNHQINAENIDIIEDSLTVVAGDEKEFQQFLKLFKSLDLSQDENFALIASKMDVDEYINYMIHKIFVGYSIVDYNNKYWRSKDKDSKWRWIAHDMEHGFGEISGDKYWVNTFSKVSGNDPLLPEWSTLIFANLIKNTSFRDRMIQRFAVYLSTIYQPEATLNILDSIKTVLQTQMPRHIQRWNSPPNIPTWNRNIDSLRNYLEKRPAYIRQHIETLFPVIDSAKIDLIIIGQGSISVSGVQLSDTLISIYFFKNAELTLQAIPAPGYQFIGWQSVSDSANISFDVQKDTAYTAVFSKQPISIIPPYINKDTILSAALAPWYALGEVQVQKGAHLIVEPGVNIYMSDKASFYIHGGLILNGTAEENITIKSNPNDWARQPIFNKSPRWGVIVADHADTIHIQHSNLSGSGFGKNRIKQFSTISAFNSPVYINHTSITDNFQPFYSEGGQIYIGYSVLRSENTCDLINVKYSANPIVEFCDLQGNNAYDTDAIDYDGVDGGIIRNNKIYGFLGDNSDGIDLGEEAKNVLIENNMIFNCIDKGISIGQASTAIIRRNLIFDCDMGVGLKDEGSFADIDQNTFYANGYSISAYEKNTSKGGAGAEVKNTILSQSSLATLEVDNKSTINITYSLSDRELLQGIGNIEGNPLFVQPSTANFQLQSNSPCIDSGDPNSPKDLDSSRSDMGAYYKHSGVFQPGIIINEINHTSANNYDTGDWIELYNYSDSAININGWKITHGFESYTFEGKHLIQPGEFLLICQDTNQFKLQHPEVNSIVGNFDFDLSTKGNISLYDANNEIAYRLSYNSVWPWPELPNGKGATLELNRINSDNSISQWRESYILMGTPGQTNSTAPEISNIYINEVMASNTKTIVDEFGENDDWFEVYNGNDFPLNIGGLYFTDKISEPQRWQAPLNHPELTTIPAKGYLLIWADGQPLQGPLHANIQLSSSGESVSIFKRILPEFRLINTLEFDAQTSDITFGRYPDGSDSLRLMSPSPSAKNMLITYIDEKTLSTISVYPNPFQSHITFNTLNIQKPYLLQIYNIAGTEVYRVQVYEESFTLPRGSFENGIYIYSIETAIGERATGKIIAY